MDELTLSEHQDLLQTILDTVKCPVCFKILQPSVSQCINGHGICGECRKQVKHCPACRNEFSPHRNILLNQLLELFPHSCQYQYCDVYIKSKDDHEKWCSFRPTQCKCCSWVGCGKNILDHVKKNHSDLLILNESNENAKLKIVNYDVGFSLLSPIYAHNNFFWLNTTNSVNEKSFKMKFYLVPNGKIESSFQFKFVLQNAKSMYSAMTTLTCHTALSTDSNVHSFGFHSSVLTEFVDKDKNVKFNLYINTC